MYFSLHPQYILFRFTSTLTSCTWSQLFIFCKQMFKISSQPATSNASYLFYVPLLITFGGKVKMLSPLPVSVVHILFLQYRLSACLSNTSTAQHKIQHRQYQNQHFDRRSFRADNCTSHGSPGTSSTLILGLTRRRFQQASSLKFYKHSLFSILAARSAHRSLLLFQCHKNIRFLMNLTQSSPLHIITSYSLQLF